MSFSNLKIREIQEGDLDLILGWRNNPKISQWMNSSRNITSDEHKKWHEKYKTEKNRKILIVLEGNKAFGFVQFNNIMYQKNCEWGFYVDPNAPRGAGSRMGILALDYAFNELKVKNVIGNVLINNVSSISFHTKMGFKKICHKLTDNVNNDCQLNFMLTAVDWFRLRSL